MKETAHELLKLWFNKADNLEKLHREAYVYFSNKDALITVPCIILSTVAGSLSFISLGNSNYYCSLAAGILNITTIILTSTREYFSWNSKIYDHYKISNEYSKLKNLIEIQIVLHKLGLNISYEKIIPEIGTLITKIHAESTRLPDFIANKYICNDTRTFNIVIDALTNETDNIDNNENQVLCDDDINIKILDEVNQLEHSINEHSVNKNFNRYNNSIL